LKADGFCIELRGVAKSDAAQPWGCFAVIVVFAAVWGLFLASYLGCFVVCGIGLLWIADLIVRGRRRTQFDVGGEMLVVRRGRKAREWPLRELERAEMLRQETLSGSGALGRAGAGQAVLFIQPRGGPQVEIACSRHAGDLQWIAEALNRALV
jgi:hypothetical protein